MDVMLPWGKQDFMNIALPKSWNFQREILPDDFRPLTDMKQMLDQSLENPIDQVPLSARSLPGCKIAVIVDDVSRPTPVHLIFPEVMKRLLSAGAEIAKITVVVSLGTHSSMGEKEICARLGTKEWGQFPVINHNCYQDQMLANLGKTSGGAEIIVNRHVCEADLIISIGTIEPHLLAGFGGGLKNIIPGCAGIKTIGATHLMGPASKRFSGVGKMGEECPTRLMIEEGAAKVPGEILLINTVLNVKGEPVGVFCGEPVKAHREGCRLAEKIYGSLVPEKADVMITGSHPMDIDLRQATKCLANASGALKEDGLLIALMRCSNGIGDMKIPEYFLPAAFMRTFAKECGTERMVDIREQFSQEMNLDEKYMLQFLTEMAKRHQVLVYAPAIPAETGTKLGVFELFSDIHDLLKRAIELMPEAKVVYSMPYGGISYAFCRD
ncbi:nickel-dependent lactate racemase [Candidatus Formimonas warabiya]|uniref:Uncharacterized protein n=1 Tax=Formimonas warabiya TaxID=1761012 RepID=A0A3G1KR66_FORW1|nr:nickel-dependent lactate racemase [Candidatus Formimonas warabiya]ATW24954.1 hypothetical protein DCMF_09370 [Candidatus Formimonas warabiya]